jgi:hypothetical protein
VSAAIVFAVLAHAQPEALLEQADNLAATCPRSELVVYDGATDPAWRASVDLPFVAASRPLRHGYLSDFHYLAMRDALARHPSFDCLVTLDSDVFVAKAGLEPQLHALLRDFAYVGARLQPVVARSEWSTGRRFMYHWARYWQPLLRAPVPFGAFNPGQVFRRDLVEAIVGDESVPAVLDAVRGARSTALEEIVYPTLALSRGFPGTSHPGSHALTMRRYTEEELRWFALDPSVFLVHKVGTEPSAPDRRLVLALAQGLEPGPEGARVPSAPTHDSRGAGFRSLLRSVAGDARILVLGP